jgi:anti-sigma factor RsiW
MNDRKGLPASDQELAAMADGTLAAERRREIENQLASSEQIRNSIQRQRAAIELTREAEVPASDFLHAQVAELASDAAPQRKRRGLAIGGFAAAAAAFLVVLALVTIPGSEDPSVNQVVATAAQGATSGAPAADPANPRKLQVSVGSVQFPSWKHWHGWDPTGARTDTVDGRRVETVYYENENGASMKYSVVDGAPIDGLGASSSAYQLTGTGETRRVVWRNGGHTCIIEAQGVPADQLERWAA